MGLNIPFEYGGQGTDYVTMGIATEEVGRADFNCTYYIAVGGMNSGLFAQYGSEELKQEWLPKVTAGEKLVGVALTEPDCGSDAAAIRTTAIRDGDGYVLNGEKCSISFINAMEAVYIFAKTNPKAGAKGVSCFFLPMDLAGITKSSFRDMGHIPIGAGGHLPWKRSGSPHRILLAKREKVFI
jgi:cyclohexanecarboxyl-CoA dehydrogenase